MEIWGIFDVIARPPNSHGLGIKYSQGEQRMGYTSMFTSTFSERRVLLMDERMLVFLIWSSTLQKESIKMLAHLAVRNSIQIFKWSVNSLPYVLPVAAEHLEVSSVNTSPLQWYSTCADMIFSLFYIYIFFSYVLEPIFRG